MAKWTVTEVNGMSCRASNLQFSDKDSMFEDMRMRVGLDGTFRCVSGAADYTYRITKYGYDKISGETPANRRRSGRKCFMALRSI